MRSSGRPPGGRSRLTLALLLFAALAAALLPGAALAAPPGGGPTPAGGVMLRYVFRQGDVRRFVYGVEIATQLPDAGAVNLDMEIALTYRVERVFPDGSATVASTIDRMEAYRLGDRVPLPDLAGFTSRQRMHPDGRVSDTEIDTASLERLRLPGGQRLPGLGGLSGIGGQGGMGQGVGGTRYPTRPLRAGEFYENDQVVDLAAFGLSGVTAAPLTARSRVTLVDVSTVGGRQVARLEETSSAALPQLRQEGVTLGMDMQGRTTYDVDVATGWPTAGSATLNAGVRLTLEGDTPIPGGGARPGASQPLTLQMTMRMTFRQV